MSHVSVFEPGVSWSRITINQAEQLGVLALFPADVAGLDDEPGVVC